MEMESTPHRQLSSEVTTDMGRGVRFRYRSIRSARAQAILTIQHEISRACRHVLDSKGFLEVLAPIIGPVTDPGIRGAGTIEVPFYGEIYVLMTSMILYKQMTVASFPRIYAFSPNIRLEASASSTTGRHLAEFYQLDLEVAHGSCEDLMTLGDTLMFKVIHTVRNKCKKQLTALGRTLHLPPRKLPRITFAEAIELLRSDGFTLDPNEEISWEAECHLSNHFGTPFWVTDYPATSRGFYYLRDADHPKLVRSMDLVLPEGYGELSSGGEREHTIEGVVQRMRETGEDPKKYGWYMDMLREGIPPSAGFGIGMERLTRYIAGVPHIWECSPFPKVPGVS